VFTLVELFEVFPLGMPGEALMGFAVFATLDDDDVVLVVVLFLHECKLYLCITLEI